MTEYNFEDWEYVNYTTEKTKRKDTPAVDEKEADRDIGSKGGRRNFSEHGKSRRRYNSLLFG